MKIHQVFQSKPISTKQNPLNRFITAQAKAHMILESSSLGLMLISNDLESPEQLVVISSPEHQNTDSLLQDGKQDVLSANW